MSNAAVRSGGLQRALARRTFVVFVARESDMGILRKGTSKGWTVPSSARPGDVVVVYKPAENAGWAAGKRKPPYEAFVAAGVVYAKPKRLSPKVFNAPLDEVQVFPRPVPRRQVADAFP